jgi:2-phosphosulfolactate phosphatase
VRVDVLLGEALPTPAEVAGKVTVVVDVLRASTTMVAALAAGARTVIPFDSVDAVVDRSRAFQRGEVFLAGERKMQPIAGFDAGNSPAEFTAERVQGRTVLLTTTNGTAALASSAGARSCFVAGFCNAAATLGAVREALGEGGYLLIVCAGQERRLALEDVACAGWFVHAFANAAPDVVIGDGAQVALRVASRYLGDPSRLADDAAHAASLRAAGYGDDVVQCLTFDTMPLVAQYAERQVVRSGGSGTPAMGVAAVRPEA